MSADLQVTLSEIAGKLDALSIETKRLADGLDHIQQKLWMGNGSPSFETRLDRLEQRQKERSKHVAILYGALVTVVLYLAGDFLESHIFISAPKAGIEARP